MAQAGDEATAPPSTTPAGSPPRSVLVEHLERQLYGIVDRTPGATTTLPRTPPIISDDNTEPSTTSPCTLRRFSTGQDTKGKDRANPVDSAVGDAAASSSGGVEETPSEAELAKAVQEAENDKVPGVAEGTLSPEKSRRRRSDSTPHWAEHASKCKDNENEFGDFENKTAPTNVPAGTEAFLLNPGEKKVEEKIDTRTPNTMLFIYNKEDHTLGNLLKDKLLKNSHVLFAAYRVPHPLFAQFELRVQTDGEVSPKEAVLAASSEIIRELEILKNNFTREYELRKMVGSATQNNEA